MEGCSGPRTRAAPGRRRPSRFAAPMRQTTAAEPPLRRMPRAAVASERTRLRLRCVRRSFGSSRPGRESTRSLRVRAVDSSYAAKGGGGEIRIGEIGAGEIGVDEIRAAQISSGKVGAAHVGAAELRPAQFGAREVGAREVREAEIGAGEIRPGKIRTSQVGRDD